MCKLKEAFVKNKHLRFKKEFAVSRHQPFWKTSVYVECIQNADVSKIAKLVKLVEMLLQTKVYLLWKKPKACFMRRNNRQGDRSSQLRHQHRKHIRGSGPKFVVRKHFYISFINKIQ